MADFTVPNTAALFDNLKQVGLSNLSFPITATLELYRQGDRSVLEQRLRPLAREAGIQNFQVQEVIGQNPWSITIQGSRR